MRSVYNVSYERDLKNQIRVRGTANNTRCRQAMSMHNSNSRTAIRGTAEPSVFALPFCSLV